MIGQRYGRLVVQERSENVGRDTAFACICDCGVVKRIRRKNLLAGTTRSCGCLYREVRAALHVGPRLRHGHARKGMLSPTFTVWQGMLRRCCDPGIPTYYLYGGRGIAVCDRWKAFENFLADMGERPTGLSLDRIDSNANYEPGNCRWATPEVQAQNKRPWGSEITPRLIARIKALPLDRRLQFCAEILPAEIASHLAKAKSILNGGPSG